MTLTRPPIRIRWQFCPHLFRRDFDQQIAGVELELGDPRAPAPREDECLSVDEQCGQADAVATMELLEQVSEHIARIDATAGSIGSEQVHKIRAARKVLGF